MFACSRGLKDQSSRATRRRGRDSRPQHDESWWLSRRPDRGSRIEGRRALSDHCGSSASMISVALAVAALSYVVSARNVAGEGAFSGWASPGTQATFELEKGSSEAVAWHTAVAGAGTALWRKRVPALGALAYRVSASVRTRAVNAAYVSGRFLVRGQLQPEVGAGHHAITGTSDRVRMTAEFTAPAGATALEVYLATKGPGDAWFSEVRLEDDLDGLLAEGDGLVEKL